MALGSFVYLLGGRGASSGTESAEILAINPRNGAVTRTGRLPLALSDAAAAAVAGRILIAGGQSASGETQSAIFALEPRSTLSAP